MWFGTKDGLNRFDGYTFKVFLHDPDDAASIGSGFIHTLYEDGDKLWVGTDKGLYHYNSQTETFTLLKVTKNSNIRAITKDKNDNLWFISGFTLYKYSESSELLQSYSTDKFFSATSICTLPDGSLWISTTSGNLHKYDPIHDSFISHNLFAQSEPSTTTWIEKLYNAGDDKIWVGTQSQGVKLFDAQDGTYADIISHDQENSEIFVRDFVKSKNDEYWIATESGLFVYNTVTEQITQLKKNYHNPYALSDNAVYSLCKDKEGGIWVGTFFGGINYFPKQYTAFEKFFPQNNENAISGNAVREITKDKYGNFWVGTEDAGLNKYDPKSRKFTRFYPTGEKGSIAHHNIHGLLAVEDELWIGTFHHGLDVMDIKTGKIIRHYAAGPDTGSLKSDFIYAIIRTTKGSILIGTSHGLYQYNAEQDNFTLLQTYPEPYPYTVSLFEDNSGNIWASTYKDGIYVINPETGKKAYFKNDPNNKNSLSSNSVNAVFQDSGKNIWIATEGGLCKFNKKEQNFKRFTRKNGFPSNVIYRILEDEQRKLWVSTSKGLVRFDPITENVKVYTKANGLLSDQFNYSSALKDEDGKMYFGCVNGMISFNPSSFIKNQYIPPVHITGFQLNNQELAVGKAHSPLEQSITKTGKITLSHGQSSFSLDFAALSYTAPEMTEYAYKMEGLSQGWTYLKTNRKVYFTELAPGSYTFMVKASNSSGLWNEQPTQLQIEILPPWWASNLAWMFYAVFAGGLIFYSFRDYHRRTEAKNRNKIRLLENEKEKEVYQAKIEFFTNVAHEIRTPLTLIKGPLETIIKATDNSSASRENLMIMEKNTNRLLDLANQLLDFRKTEINGFSLTFVKADISKLILETFSRFKPAADQQMIDYAIELPHESLCAYVDPEAFIKILSNLLSNAIKYAAHKAHLRLLPFDMSTDKRFTIVIKNDGPRIPLEMSAKIFEPFYRLKESEKKQGTGIGLSLALSLTELHKGSLELDTMDKELNVFSLTLPVHQEREFNLYATDTRDKEKAIPDANTASSPEDVDASKPIILIVEDNNEMQDFIAGAVGKDYHPAKAFNGLQALQIIESENVQLVISDVMMPQMDGFELSKRIKTNLNHSHIPIILLTAKNSLSARIEGLESGADAYIEKPFSVEHLQVQISNLLQNRSKIRTYFSSSPLAHIKSMAYTKADEAFLGKIDEAILKNIAEPDLSVDHLADIVNMSRTTLYRKIKAISNLTPNELINIARLKKAAELLLDGSYKIYEVAHMVGYNSQTSFGRNFLKQFGMTPTEYVNKELHKKPE